MWHLFRAILRHNTLFLLSYAGCYTEKADKSSIHIFLGKYNENVERAGVFSNTFDRVRSVIGAKQCRYRTEQNYARWFLSPETPSGPSDRIEVPGAGK